MRVEGSTPDRCGQVAADPKMWISMEKRRNFVDIKQFRRRVWAIVALLAVVMTSLGSAMYDLQINHG